METILQKDYAVLSYNEHKELMVLHLISDITFENYKMVLNTLIEKLSERNCNKLIVDQRYTEKIGMEEKAWLVAHWFPNLQKIITQDFKMGVISSNSLFARIGSEYIVNTLKSKSNLNIQLHSSMNEAVKWMQDE